MKRPLRWRCALVTGASAGLGAEFARQLAPFCDHLVLVARRAERLEELGGRLQEEYPHLRVWVIGTDLTLASHRESLVSQLKEHNLEPGLLVNNAGMGDYGEFAEADWGKTGAMIELNVKALTHLTHLLLPGILRERGDVINVSSLAGDLPIPDFAVYAATKAYVTSFSEGLRLELRERGANVVAVCPGPVHTEFGSVARREGHAGAPIPDQGWFYTDPATVVGDALAAVAKGQARVYPGWKINLASVALAAVPLVALRMFMGMRPRRVAN